jgi:hypothetical protein
LVNMLVGEYEHKGNEGWRTPDDSWLDLEEEDDLATYHVNVLIDEDGPGNHDHEDNPDKERHLWTEKSDNTYLDVCVAAVPESKMKKKEAMTTFRKRKDDFQDSREENRSAPCEKEKVRQA